MALSPEVDLLVASGDLAKAADLLEAGLTDAALPAHWLQLAGLRRALRQPHRALEAVHRALALAPFDFMALAMRAGLLERMADSGAGRAWGEALVYRPTGELPPPLAAAVTAGEQLYKAWQEQREAGLKVATTASEAGATTDERWKIARFRDNVLGRTTAYHSRPTHFHFPGLTEREFHPRDRFPWLVEVEANTDAIRAEMRALIASDRAELVPYLDYGDHEPLAQWRALNRNPDWTAVHLIQRGEAVAANAAQCPQTLALLARLPQPEVPGASPNAMFSLLAPGTAIPAHVGVNNTRLVCHLGLDVPGGCRFRVGAEWRDWQEGEAFVFDDTIEHEAINPSEHLRVVLIFDVWHPDLRPREQQAAAAVVAAEGVAGAL